jgi:hypothetical protein
MKRLIIVAAALIAILIVSGCGKSHISGAYRDENDRTVEFFFTSDGLFSGAINGPATGFHGFRGTYTIKGDEITMIFTDADNQKPVGDMAKPETGSVSSDRNTIRTDRTKRTLVKE